MKRSLIFIVLAVLAMGAAVTRVDFSPLAPVRLVKPNGQVFGYGYGAATDADRGAALLSAQTASASGDTILVDADCEIATDSSIGKDGLRYWFGPVVITKSTGTAGLVSDGGNSISFVVEGSGAFETTAVCSPVKITGASSVFTMTGRRCWSRLSDTNPANDIASIQCTGGPTTTIRLTEFSRSANYDAYWSGTGTHYIEAPVLDGSDQAIEVTTVLGSGSTTARVARLISADDALQLTCAGSYTINIEADSISCGAGFYAIQAACSGSAQVCIRCPKVNGPVTAGATKLIDATVDASTTDLPAINASATGNVYQNVRCITKSGQDSVAGSAATVVGGLAVDRTISASLTYASKTGDAATLAATTPGAGGLAVLDDASTSAVRNTLGLGTGDSPTFGGNVTVGNLLTSAGSDSKFIVDRNATSSYARFMWRTTGNEIWAMGLRGDSGTANTFTLTGLATDSYPLILTITPGTPYAMALNGNFSASAISSLTTPLSVGNGGTGAATLASGALLKGAGTSAITTATAGTDYYKSGATTSPPQLVSLVGFIPSPNDATAYFVGDNRVLSGSVTSSTTAALRRVYIPFACTVTKGYISVTNEGTASTGETSTVAIRVNNSSDTTISSSVVTNANGVFSNTSMSLALAAGDYIEIKWTTPTWPGANPTNVGLSVQLELRP